MSKLQLRKYYYNKSSAAKTPAEMPRLSDQWNQTAEWLVSAKKIISNVKLGRTDGRESNLVRQTDPTERIRQGVPRAELAAARARLPLHPDLVALRLHTVRTDANVSAGPLPPYPCGSIDVDEGTKPWPGFE